ncbi:hypothetical protein [Brevundimonas sp.]|uniref:hypothetical protein n=1 Tax=Brevundimonas sp. TaxID=1871086 RepID=UPI0017D6B47E|nr:hypothetical protein [Brevundimonas sp.]MBA4807060.1 hypothetical protein [Brevundimonas sp.]
MTKTAITNDKPKGEPTLAAQIGLLVAMEVGKELGRQEAEAQPVVNTERLAGPFGFRLPAGGQAVANAADKSRLGYRLPADRPGHTPPKAIHDGEQVTNTVKPISQSHYKLPKAED